MYSLVSSRNWAAQRAKEKRLLETTNKTVDDFHEWSGLIHKQRHAKEVDPSFGEADLPTHRSEIERGASKRPPHTTPLRCCCWWSERGATCFLFSFLFLSFCFFFFFWVVCGSLATIISLCFSSHNNRNLSYSKQE